MSYVPVDREKFDVLGMRFDTLKNIKLSKHVKERGARLKEVEQYKGGVDIFIVDTGHKNGLEEHYILPDASILIVNRKSRKLITVLHARPNQIKRYYVETKMEWDNEVIERAYENTVKGKNYL